MKSIIKLPIFILAIIMFSFIVIAAILSGIESFQNLSLSFFSMLTLILSYTIMILTGLLFSIYLKPPYVLQAIIVIIIYLCIALLLGGLNALPTAALRMAAFSLVTVLFQLWKKRMKTS